ncbi:ADP-ribose pyrophosphatase YjhB, NUDIX family [Gracilibacillus ureilyticus]|uniref:ADP-ribose pyrophosphatase YjhB, NUDIX family n=1 Tax=Gracilibacillus ureilyticus TaxID=531814 RepID=A0A1H9W1T7_9BACI|nr:NUDIX hydrolase [Gracilibacillus ureilyticus]SES27657.1 ADP-ribose pyrophosphatase YjhB, NUDIX family [Gracilibacillus ureilyticus]
MEKWVGSSAVCINECGELLMVLQGRADEKKKWSVPSGGMEKGETLEQCCIREVWEETGYLIEIEEGIKVKNGTNLSIPILTEVHYFSVKITGGKRKIQDPDNLIYDIAWKTLDELKRLELSFPEDREFLIDLLKEAK